MQITLHNRGLRREVTTGCLMQIWITAQILGEIGGDDICGRSFHNRLHFVHRSHAYCPKNYLTILKNKSLLSIVKERMPLSARGYDK